MQTLAVVFQQTPFTPEELEDEFGGRGVGKGFECRPHAAADRIDPTIQGEIEAVRTVKGDDEVGEQVTETRNQVDRPFQGFC